MAVLAQVTGSTSVRPFSWLPKQLEEEEPLHDEDPDYIIKMRCPGYVLRCIDNVKEKED
jgi:hypothetical protein